MLSHCALGNKLDIPILKKLSTVFPKILAYDPFDAVTCNSTPNLFRYSNAYAGSLKVIFQDIGNEITGVYGCPFSIEFQELTSFKNPMLFFKDIISQ